VFERVARENTAGFASVELPVDAVDLGLVLLLFALQCAQGGTKDFARVLVLTAL
jgi:hypothetical protein